MRRIGAKIGRRFPGAASPHQSQPSGIVEQNGIVLGAGKARKGVRKLCRRAGIGRAVEHPGPLLEPLKQARFAEQLQMPADARLALAENLGQLADGQLRFYEQKEQAQPGRVSRRAQHAEKFFHPARLRPQGQMI